MQHTYSAGLWVFFETAFFLNNFGDCLYSNTWTHPCFEYYLQPVSWMLTSKPSSRPFPWKTNSLDWHAFNQNREWWQKGKLGLKERGLARNEQDKLRLEKKTIKNTKVEQASTIFNLSIMYCGLPDTWQAPYFLVPERKQKQKAYWTIHSCRAVVNLMGHKLYRSADFEVITLSISLVIVRSVPLPVPIRKLTMSHIWTLQKHLGKNPFVALLRCSIPILGFCKTWTFIQTHF